MQKIAAIFIFFVSCISAMMDDKTKQSDIKSNEKLKENKVFINMLIEMTGEEMVDDVMIEQEVPMRIALECCFDAPQAISRAVDYFSERQYLDENATKIKKNLLLRLKMCKRSLDLTRKGQRNNAFKDFLATCISSFSTIWGVRSLFNKENSSKLSYSLVVGGSVGVLSYAVPSLIKNFSSWHVTKVKEQQYRDWLTKLKSTKE